MPSRKHTALARREGGGSDWGWEEKVVQCHYKLAIDERVSE